MDYVIVISIIGLVLSAYAYYVERRSSSEKKYKAVCDISDRMSCSKAFRSSYGSHMGISNSVLGVGFYLIVGLLSYFSFDNLVFYLSAISVIGSVYLAYVLYFKLKNLCIVCTSIYIVNIILLILSWKF